MGMFRMSWMLMLVIGISQPAALAQEIEPALEDVVSTLNDRLAGKEQTSRERIVSVREEKCRMMGCAGKAKEGPCEPVCEMRTVKRPQVYSDQQRVENGFIVAYSELQLDESKAKDLPTETHEKSVIMENCTSLNQSSSQTLTLSVDRTDTVTVARGVATTVKADVGVNVGIAKVGVSVSRTVSLNTTKQQAERKAETHAYTFPIQIAPGTAVDARIWVNVVKVEVPFSGHVVVDGALLANAAGRSKASELLLEEERIIPVAGTISATSASRLHTRMAESKIDCGARDDLITVSYEDIRSLAAKSVAGQVSSLRSNFDVGALCYEGPCNLPLDGYRPVCYRTEFGCDDCRDESSAVCDAPPPEPIIPPLDE